MQHINLFLAGDSTMSSYDASRAPMAGWGQALGSFLNGKATVYNEASPGRSSKSFIDESRLENIDNRIRSGDYLFIQFGHNDQKSDEERHTEPFGTYLSYLTQYIDTARSRQAFPVLITPVQRRSFTKEGHFRETHRDYPEAMKRLAGERQVPLIDLTTKSKILYETLGSETSKQLFVWLKPGDHPNYSDGAEDNTHFNEYGAGEIAKLVIEGIKESGLPIAEYFKK